ncbi:hypothetical protein QUB05_33065 [Microcoleus sp. F10-C6]
MKHHAIDSPYEWLTKIPTPTVSMLGCLLYTEWVMLVSCGSFALMEAFEQQHLPFPHIPILALLGGMGLMLPKSPTALKLLDTCIEIAWIF